MEYASIKNYKCFHYPLREFCALERLVVFFPCEQLISNANVYSGLCPKVGDEFFPLFAFLEHSCYHSLHYMNWRTRTRLYCFFCSPIHYKTFLIRIETKRKEILTTACHWIDKVPRPNAENEIENGILATTLYDRLQ